MDTVYSMTVINTNIQNKAYAKYSTVATAYTVRTILAADIASLNIAVNMVKSVHNLFNSVKVVGI